MLLKRLKLKPIIYEVEIIKMSKEISVDQLTEFSNWVATLPDSFPTGKNHEFYSYNENHLDDISVTFIINRLN